MLVNIIQNTISSFRSALAAAEVITTNLKMWLGFETSETLGRELVVNGDFTNNITGWTAKNCTVSYDNSKLKVSGTTNASGGAYQDIGLVTGKYYKMTATIQLLTASSNGTFSLLSSQSGGTGQTTVYTGSTLVVGGDAVTETFIFTPGLGDVSIQLSSDESGATYTIDNVSVKELTQFTPDKSGNNNVGELFTGKALEFDGTNDKVDFASFTTPIKCAVFWYKPHIVSNFNSIIGFGGVSVQTIKIANNQGNITSSNLSGVDVYVDGVQTTSVTLNQWQRVVVNFNLKTPLDLTFGWAFNNYGDCELSDIQLYNENLTTDDIAYDYANPQNLVTDRDGTSIELSNLKGYWALSEGAGSLVYDSSGEGNNGTINGATYELAQPRIPQLGMMNWSKGSNLLTYSEDFSQWVKTNVGISSSSIDSPIGTNNVDYFVPTTTTGTHIIKLTTASLSDDKVISINVKVDSAINKVTLFPGGSNTFANFDLSNLTSTKESNVVSTNIVDLGSSWYRLEAVYNSAITLDRFQFYASSGSIGASETTENGTNGINIWGAQLVEGTSASAYRLTDGAVTSLSTVIPNPTTPTKDIFGNLVRDRLNSLNLDGSGYAKVADDTDLDFGTGAFSIDGWAKYTFVNSGSITGNAIYSNGGTTTAATNNFAIATHTTSGNRRVRFFINSEDLNFDITSNVSDGAWFYFAGTRDTSGNFKLYINDLNAVTQSQTGNSGNTVTTTNVRYIGRDSGVNRYYKNLIDDIRLYKDKELSATEVENNYNAGLSAHTND